MHTLFPKKSTSTHIYEKIQEGYSPALPHTSFYIYLAVSPRCYVVDSLRCDSGHLQ